MKFSNPTLLTFLGTVAKVLIAPGYIPIALASMDVSLNFETVELDANGAGCATLDDGGYHANGFCCPQGWTCTGVARLYPMGDQYSQSIGLSGSGSGEGEQYFQLGRDNDMGTGTSNAFVLPAGTTKVLFKRAGGAENGGLRVYRSSNHQLICEKRDGRNWDTFFENECDVSGASDGELVYLYVWDCQNSGWGKTFIDDIRFVDGSGNPTFTGATISATQVAHSNTLDCSNNPIQIQSATTTAPTKAPTSTPTQSPTHSPWNLAHASGDAQYNNSDEEAGTVTSVWDYYSPLLSGNDNFIFVSNIKAGVCGDGGGLNKVLEGQRSGGLLTAGDNVGVGLTGSCTRGPVTTSGQVSCDYTFDKSSMNSIVGYTPASGGSNTAYQRLCEIAQLQYASMVLTELYMDIEVKFNLTAGFNVEGIDMTKATILASDQETSLSDYVQAAKCEDGNLGPNQVLCIRVTSLSDDIKIETLDSMTMNGNAQEGGNSLVVVDNNGISYPSITSVANEGTGAVTIETRVPTNTFNFEANGALNVNGAVTLKFADGTRRLVALKRELQVNEDESAKFSVTINLQRENEDLGLEGADTLMNSSKATTGGKALVVLGMAIATAFALC